jgi:hypothetical protein
MAEAPGPTLTAQLRCSLILGSLRSVGARIPPNVLIASAIRGILSHQQALYLGRAAGPERFCIVAAGIADRLAEPERREVLAGALAATAAIRDGNPRAQAFANLAPHLSEQ